MIRVVKILYLMFCIIAACFVSFYTLVVLSSIIITGFILQLFLFLCLSIILVVCLWLLYALKISFSLKLILFLLPFFLLGSYMGISSKMFPIYKVVDEDICLDMGLCKEGLEVNTEYGKIKINEKNCKKYHWVWNEEKRYCKVIPN